MADKKITQLTTTISVSDDDFIPIVDTGQATPSLRNQKVKMSVLKAYMASGADYSTRTANEGENIYVRRLVILRDNQLYTFDPTNETHYGLLVGFLINKGITGKSTYVTSGIYQSEFLSLTPNAIYYSDSDGKLTTVTPAEGIYQEVGFAVSTDKIFINLGQPSLITEAAVEYTQAEKNKVNELSELRKDPVQSQAVLTSLPQLSLEDKEDRLVENEGGYYRYDAHSDGSEDGALAPDDQTGGVGFWIPVGFSGNVSADKITETTDRQFVTATEKAKLTQDYGYYDNDTLLNAAHPTGISGAYVRIGSTDTIWVWSTGTNSWVNSGKPITGYIHPDHTGDVTSNGDGQTTISEGAVTFSKINSATKAASGEESSTKLVVANDSRLRAKWRGTHLTFSALQTAHPTGLTGDWAFVKPSGGTITEYVYDGGWIPRPVGSSLTSQQEDIINSVGDATQLNTTSKILVGAINEVLAAIGGVGALTSEDIDTLAEINAIINDADVASETFVTALTNSLETGKKNKYIDVPTSFTPGQCIDKVGDTWTLASATVEPFFLVVEEGKAITPGTAYDLGLANGIYFWNETTSELTLTKPTGEGEVVRVAYKQATGEGVFVYDNGYVIGGETLSASARPVEVPFTAAIAFEEAESYSEVTLDADYILSLGENAEPYSYYMLTIEGDGVNSITIPGSWKQDNSVLLDNSLTQRLIFFYDGTRLNYTITDITASESDVTPPTVSITSTSSSPTDDNPIPVTFTLSEDSDDFVSGDLVLGNCTVQNFAGSGSIYTADLVPSGIGNVTVNIPADSFTDLEGNGNTAATQFLIVYDPSIEIDVDSELYIDAAYPESFSLSGSKIIQANDLSGNGRHMTQSLSSKRLDLINNEIVFNDTNLAHLVRTFDLLAFQFQDQTPFTIILKGVNITEAKSQFLLSYRVGFGTGSVNHGWSIFYSVGTQTLQMSLVGAGETLKNAQYNVGAFTTKTNFIFTNESGVLKIYDENNVNVGTNGTGTASSVDYSGLSLMLGSRNPAESTDQYFWTGKLGSVEILSRVLNESERAAKLGL